MRRVNPVTVLLILVGVASVCAAAWVLHPSAGLTVTGLILIAAGVAWYDDEKPGPRR